MGDGEAVVGGEGRRLGGVRLHEHPPDLAHVFVHQIDRVRRLHDLEREGRRHHPRRAGGQAPGRRIDLGMAGRGGVERLLVQGGVGGGERRVRPLARGHRGVPQHPLVGRPDAVQVASLGGRHRRGLGVGRGRRSPLGLRRGGGDEARQGRCGCDGPADRPARLVVPSLHRWSSLGRRRAHQPFSASLPGRRSHASESWAHAPRRPWLALSSSSA